MSGQLSTGKNMIFTLAPLPTGLGAGVEVSRPESATNTHPALTLQHLDGGDDMAPEADNPQGGTAQRFIDPLVSQARLINEAAHIERRLAIRRALRPERSNAAKRGWEARRDR